MFKLFKTTNARWNALEVCLAIMMMATIIVVYPQIGSAFASRIADLGKVEATPAPSLYQAGLFGQGESKTLYTHAHLPSSFKVFGDEENPQEFRPIFDAADQRYGYNWVFLHSFHNRWEVVIKSSDEPPVKIWEETFPRETDPREIAAAITNHIPTLPLQG